MAISAGAEEESGFNAINVTPLTDVLLVLLIIFLITGSSITAPSHDIVLPEVITKEKAEDVNIVVDISTEGVMYVGNVQQQQQLLQGYLKAMGQKRKTDKVIINADSKTPYKYVVIAMNAARKAGLINIALATELDEQGHAQANAEKKVKVKKDGP